MNSSLHFIYRVSPKQYPFVVNGVVLPYIDVIATAHQEIVKMAKQLIPDLNDEASANQVGYVEKISYVPTIN